MSSWNDFFMAEVGAAAAVAGLVLVAVSIKLKQIISSPPLPNLAAEALLGPFATLLVSSLALAPQPNFVPGIEVLLLGLAE